MLWRHYDQCNHEKKGIPKVTLSLGLFSPPYPLFQWYLQSEDILLNLKMKCWNSAFNAQGSRLIIVVVHVGAVKIYVAATVEALRKKERTGWSSVYHQYWRETSLSPIYYICFEKFSFSVTCLMAYYAETGCFHPLIARLYR
jgi:hypothetical protein